MCLHRPLKACGGSRLKGREQLFSHSFFFFLFDSPGNCSEAQRDGRHKLTEGIRQTERDKLTSALVV